MSDPNHDWIERTLRDKPQPSGRKARRPKGVSTRVWSAQEMNKLVNQRMHWHPEPTKRIGVTVQVLDAKEAFGRLLVKITPTGGTGFLWVRLDSLSSVTTAPETPAEPR